MIRFRKKRWRAVSLPDIMKDEMGGAVANCQTVTNELRLRTDW